jgi:hypothetical protein
MDSFQGKICPYCKTRISLGEELTVCPVREMPHHRVRREKNKGCTTFGCVEQYYEPRGTNFKFGSVRHSASPHSSVRPRLTSPACFTLRLKPRKTGDFARGKHPNC